MSTIAQIALCTADLPRTARTFVEILGFSHAGGKPRWGADAAVIQELPSGDDTSVLMWWLLGRQDFLQIELFQHIVPAQRPRRSGWRPSDLGWSRFGVWVPDFDATLKRLGERGLATITPEPMVAGGRRRVCFRELGSDAIIEILEQAPGESEPAVAYAAVSVSDLQTAREYFGDALGLTELASDALHGSEHEALWGLTGARRDCAVFTDGDVLLEVLVYESPAPRAPAADALLSDQGFMNIALGYREHAEMQNDFEALLERGATATTEAPVESGSVYLRIFGGLSIEQLLVPPGLDEPYGFVRREVMTSGRVIAPAARTGPIS